MINTKILNIPIKNKIKLSNGYSDSLKFYFSKQEHNKIFDSFLTAINNQNYYEAKQYLSKDLRNTYDIKKLYSTLKTEKNINSIIKLNFDNKHKKNSVLVINQNTRNNIIHMQLVYEPDENSMWKIFCITKE